MMRVCDVCDNKITSNNMIEDNVKFIMQAKQQYDDYKEKIEDIKTDSMSKQEQIDNLKEEIKLVQQASQGQADHHKGQMEGLAS